jgi:TusE/DsrC/DsvC family sulfur relay protein
MSMEMKASPLIPEIDEEGFLSNSETWNKDVAELLAQEEVRGGLKEDHWKVIDYLRGYYLDFNSVPPVKMLCKRTGLKFNYICELFPSGLTRGACKIAGIPRNTIKPGFLYP